VAVTVNIDCEYQGETGTVEAYGQAPTGGATMRLAASKVRGYKVINYDNEDLGTIEDLMLDTTTGRLGYAILSFLGLAGGEKLLPVPIKALTVDAAGRRFMLNADRTTLNFAPAFDRRDLPAAAYPRWKARIDNYYRF
jgi:sporulation protein YlmC with PRC-barrel domain